MGPPKPSTPGVCHSTAQPTPKPTPRRKFLSLCLLMAPPGACTKFSCGLCGMAFSAKATPITAENAAAIMDFQRGGKPKLPDEELDFAVLLGRSEGLFDAMYSSLADHSVIWYGTSGEAFGSVPYHSLFIFFYLLFFSFLFFNYFNCLRSCPSAMKANILANETGEMMCSIHVKYKFGIWHINSAICEL